MGIGFPCYVMSPKSIGPIAMSWDSCFLPDDVLFGSTPWSMKNLSKLIPNLSLQLLFCLSQHLHEIFLCCYLFRVYTWKWVSLEFYFKWFEIALLRMIEDWGGKNQNGYPSQKSRRIVSLNIGDWTRSSLTSSSPFGRIER